MCLIKSLQRLVDITSQRYATISSIYI